MATLVLHHYPQSPFAEKARLMLGFKGLAWDSVTIPRVMPKPDLVALTGGYRKTPVLQVDADIYCDTALIARRLERRKPQPTLFPPGLEAVAATLAHFADHELFQHSVALNLTIYDPRDTAALIARVRAEPGPVLIVGHSNTVPDIVAALGGTRPAPLVHEDFGDLWIVQPGGATTRQHIDAR
jgi:glutathione S-transferase